jgi:hypothetical protein
MGSFGYIHARGLPHPHFRRYRKPVWIEAIGRPRKVIVHAIEAKAEEMLNLLRRAPSVPAGRLVCTRDRQQAWDGYDVAVRIDGAGLSQLAHGELAMTGICGWRSALGQARLRARL